MLKFRSLRADEIDCRVAAVKLPEGDKKGGLSLLLYKDARVDQNILDETVGPMNWQRRHTRDNANCIVSLWDEEKKQWIEKEDTGTESNTEAEKGLASDSFKRACFNWGIGRELYTAPFIWIPSDKCNIYARNTQKGQVGACNDKFYVGQITITDGQITSLLIINASQGNKVVFEYGKLAKTAPADNIPVENGKKEPKNEVSVQETKPKLDPITVNELKTLAERAGVDLKPILAQAKKEDLASISKSDAEALKKSLQRRIMQNRSRNGNQGADNATVA